MGHARTPTNHSHVRLAAVGVMPATLLKVAVTKESRNGSGGAKRWVVWYRQRSRPPSALTAPLMADMLADSGRGRRLPLRLPPAALLLPVTVPAAEVAVLLLAAASVRGIDSRSTDCLWASTTDGAEVGRRRRTLGSWACADVAAGRKLLPTA